MEFTAIEIKKEEDHNVIIGQSHFIKTVEDVHEALITAVPGIKFGLAFCEASGPRLIRKTGTDESLTQLAVENAQNIAAGHFFILFLKDAFPINVLKKLQSVEEIVAIWAATANPTKVIIAEEGEQRAVLGVFDGFTPLGVEGEDDIQKRKDFLRMIGYKTK